MHHLRLVLGAALTAAAIGAVPSLASAASTCEYSPSNKDVNVIDGSGAGKLHVVRSGQRIMVSDGSGPLLPCMAEATSGSDQLIPATVTNTSRISLLGPVATSGDGYVIDQSAGPFSPQPSGRPAIKVTAYTNANVPASLQVIATAGPDTIKVGRDGLVDVDNDGVTDVSVNAGTTSVTLNGGDKDDFLSGDGFGLHAHAWVPLYLFGGDGADQMIGGANDDHFFGGEGSDVFHAVGGGEDTLFGEGGWDTANVDHFDTFGDAVEQRFYGF